MLTVVVNVIAFYFGAVVLDTNPLLGVVVFLVTALPGTILSTMFEVSVRSVLFSSRQIGALGASHDA